MGLSLVQNLVQHYL
jgi:hypothetical protein